MNDLAGTLAHLLDVVADLLGQLARMNAGPAGPVVQASVPERTAPARQLGGQLVSLDQVAVMVRLQKRSLERYRKSMPPPAVRGGRGRRALWRWSEVRPWVEATFGLPMPEEFPCLR